MPSLVALVKQDLDVAAVGVAGQVRHVADDRRDAEDLLGQLGLDAADDRGEGGEGAAAGGHQAGALGQQERIGEVGPKLARLGAGHVHALHDPSREPLRRLGEERGRVRGDVDPGLRVGKGRVRLADEAQPALRREVLDQSHARVRASPCRAWTAAANRPACRVLPMLPPSASTRSRAMPRAAPRPRRHPRRAAAPARSYGRSRRPGDDRGRRWRPRSRGRRR